MTPFRGSKAGSAVHPPYVGHCAGLVGGEGVGSGKVDLPIMSEAATAEQGFPKYQVQVILDQERLESTQWQCPGGYSFHEVMFAKSMPCLLHVGSLQKILDKMAPAWIGKVLDGTTRACALTTQTASYMSEERRSPLLIDYYSLCPTWDVMFEATTKTPDTSQSLE